MGKGKHFDGAEILECEACEGTGTVAAVHASEDGFAFIKCVGCDGLGFVECIECADGTPADVVFDGLVAGSRYCLACIKGVNSPSMKPRYGLRFTDAGRAWANAARAA